MHRTTRTVPHALRSVALHRVPVQRMPMRWVDEPVVQPFGFASPLTISTEGSAASVGYVMDRFPRGSHGFVLQEILALEARGVDVHVFSLGMPDGRLDDTAFALARLKSPVCYFLADTEASGGVPEGTMFAPDYIASDPTCSAMTSRAAHWVARQVGARRIHHLHAHGATVATDVAREAGRLTGVGYSFTAHARDLHDAIAPSVREKVLEAQFAVTLSEFDHARLAQICGQGAADKLHRIPMGVDTDECRSSKAVIHDIDSVLSVGPLLEESGFTDLIDAIRLMRERGLVARATILGEGKFEEALRARIDRCGLSGQVQIMASASRRDLARLMQSHTVMVLPWTAHDGDRDVLTNLVLDAMAAGLPVLSTDGPSIRELIDDGLNGRVISSRDPLGLAGALETFFASARLRESMASNARATVELVFAARQNVTHLAKLFSGTVATRPLGA